MNRPKILVIDDDRERNDVLKRLIVQLDYAVFQAFDGEEGKAMALVLKPDLILLDVLLPGLNGFELLKKLKGQKETAGCFIVMISSNLITSEDQLEGFDSGADGYLIFPMSNREFMSRLQAFLRHLSTMNELRRSEASLQALLDITPEGIILINDIGTITYANEAACKIFSKTLEELNKAEFGLPVIAGESAIIDFQGTNGIRTIEIRKIEKKTGEDQFFVVFLNDITDLNSREQKLNTQISALLMKEE